MIDHFPSLAIFRCDVLKGLEVEEKRTPVVLSSFQGKNQHLMLCKKQGYEEADVLDDPAAEGQLLSSLHSRLSEHSQFIDTCSTD